MLVAIGMRGKQGGMRLRTVDGWMRHDGRRQEVYEGVRHVMGPSIAYATRLPGANEDRRDTHLSQELIHLRVNSKWLTTVGKRGANAQSRDSSARRDGRDRRGSD